MKLFPLRLILVLTILASLVLSSGCIGQSSQSISQEERTQSELKQDIPLSDQKEPKSSSNPTSDDQSESKPTSPLPPISVWAIPFLSTRDALQLYDLLDESDQGLARELVSIHDSEAVFNPDVLFEKHTTRLKYKNCLKYFGPGSLFEKVKIIRFSHTGSTRGGLFVDPECMSLLPKTLKELSLERHMLWNEVWREIIQNITERASGLEILRIEKASLTLTEIQMIAQRLKSLRTLSLVQSGVGEQGAIVIAENLPKLTSLDLEWNLIGPEGAKAIADKLPRLTYLNLQLNSIRDEGVRAIALAHFQFLTHLNLSYNAIGDSLTDLTQANFPRLTHLELKGLRKDVSRIIAQGKFPCLTHLNLSGSGIKQKGEKLIRENLPQLVELINEKD